MAKNIVAAGLADRCEVQLSYAIGLSDPMSVRIDTFDTARVDEAIIRSMLKAHADPRPAAIIQKFNLTAPQYSKVACYGHFGSNAAELPWEQTDIARALQG
jgi:S-adenosylmethionine synthetase